MAKNDRDLFDRARALGVRKRVARTLSEIGEDASKKSTQAARATVAQLRALADEIERRLPRERPAQTSGTRTRPGRPAPTSAKRTRPGPPAPTNGKRTAPNQNKAKILASLKSGPKTASEIAKETRIAAGTVGSALRRMATAGDVVKADRGYGLPK